MSKKLLMGAIVALFLLSGCSDKAQVDVGGEYVDTKASGASGTSGTSGTSGASIGASGGSSATGTVGGVDDPNVSSLIAKLEGDAKSIYFSFDQFNVKSSELSSIEHNAELFRDANAADLNIKIEGNCDEWGTDEYNYALGLKRAKAVKDEIVARGVLESRVTIVSYGESNPACTSSSKECWSKNRRADFKLIP
ncbi:MAG: OmpA family protein [Campylobacteraceae bacterium]|jgi:peptidoglycan-associated lipoprotein|nr:OmpA family protein [Campylobacteraceae bacterium]